jgi:PAS domain S-box-containing protein
VGDAPRNAADHDALAELSAEKERFRELSDAAFEALVVHDRAVIVDANQVFLEMFGYSRAEVSGLHALDLCAPESRETVVQKIASGATAPYEAVGLRRNGSKFLGQLRGGPIHYQGRNLRVVAIRDISEQRQLEAQVQLQQQLLSMNSLAAGVAHEINNPLTYVLGNLQIMSQLLDDLVARAATPPAVMTELRRCLDETLIGTERVRGIVSDLRRLSRPSGPEWVAVDLRTALESALRLAGNEIRHRARVVRRWADAPPVLGSELRLVQVFVNLLLNAAQAIDEGRAGANEVVVSLAVEARGWVVVEISDTGRGMAPEIQSRIFEPFFTTRPGCGVGLGLSISRSIVTELGGEISASSTPGRGSSFRVTLPLSSPPERARTPGATPAATRRLRVLIVDDEAAVGRTLGRLVADEHHVDTVVSLAQAIARIREAIAAGQRYDVVLCDLMMPEGTGMDLHARVMDIDPGLARRMLFMTGGVFTPAAEQFLAQPDIQVIDKPIRRDPLLAALARAAER